LSYYIPSYIDTSINEYVIVLRLLYYEHSPALGEILIWHVCIKISDLQLQASKKGDGFFDSFPIHQCQHNATSNILCYCPSIIGLISPCGVLEDSDLNSEYAH
jgi:hypothetical protein